MFKITMVSPYQELIDFAKETFEEHNEYETTHNFDSIKNEYKFNGIVASSEDAKSMATDADVIIARGYTAAFLKATGNQIPVVEIPVAGNDLISSIDECKKRYGVSRAAVIGTKNMIFGADELSRILGMEIESFEMENFSKGLKEGFELVELAKSKGYKVIISGIGVCRYAVSTGLNAVVIKTGKESLWQAITEAKRVANISRREQERAELFKNILDYSNEGVIAVDKKNKISVVNSAAKRILNIREKDVENKNFENIISPSKLIDLANKEEECLDEVIRHNGVQLAINKINTNVKGEDVGKLLIFQEVSGIQEREVKIRNKLHALGHIAKHTFSDIVGKSPQILNCIELAKSISKVDSNILIVGETGTGKEIFAQSIHNFSLRSNGPFVAVNCAALPESLLESELFGYVEGAFTGAIKGGKPGLFELAHRGTIFLDEIGEVSEKLQSRLLRVIQEREIMRLGGDRVIPVNVRIITATNKDLKELIIKGNFRQDLYYRLDVLKLKLPALRERKEDIGLLAEQFLKKHGKTLNKINIKITDSAIKILEGFEFFGNIRELSNICERLVVLSKSSTINEEDVKRIIILESSQNITSNNIEEREQLSHDNYGRVLSTGELSKEKIENALKLMKYNKIKTSKYLGISRSTLYNYIKEHGISL